VRLKAQASVEAFIVIAFIFLLIVPITVFAYQIVSYYLNKVNAASVNAFTVQLARNVDRAMTSYENGVKSKVSFITIIPDGVKCVKITGGLLTVKYDSGVLKSQFVARVLYNDDYTVCCDDGEQCSHGLKRVSITFGNDGLNIKGVKVGE